jgi:hypothetical protein
MNGDATILAMPRAARDGGYFILVRSRVVVEEK